LSLTDLIPALTPAAPLVIAVLHFESNQLHILAISCSCQVEELRPSLGASSLIIVAVSSAFKKQTSTPSFITNATSELAAQEAKEEQNESVPDKKEG
jgi:hypothetical protein